VEEEEEEEEEEEAEEAEEEERKRGREEGGYNSLVERLHGLYAEQSHQRLDSHG